MESTGMNFDSTFDDSESMVLSSISAGSFEEGSTTVVDVDDYYSSAAVGTTSAVVGTVSAPTERLFSIAGLTIANDRAGLTPENASSLVFLKGVGKLFNDFHH